MALHTSQYPRPASAASALEDRRRAPRLDHQVQAWLSNESGNVKSAQQQVMVFDLSLRGVGFRSAKALDIGSVYWIVMGNGPLHLSTRLRVVNCQDDENATYRIGAEFF